MNLLMFTFMRQEDSELTKVIQGNAVRSWLSLEPTPWIWLYSEDTNNLKDWYGVKPCVPVEAPSNEYGVATIRIPLREVQELTGYDVFGFVNSDNIFFQSIIKCLDIVRAKFPQFLVIGRRVNMDITEPLEFDWKLELWDRATTNPDYSPAYFVDYLFFTRGLFMDVPEFAVGMTSYDNWLVWKAVSAGVPVVNVTLATKVIHQNHPQKVATEDVIKQRLHNRQLSQENLCGVDHATWKLVNGELTPGGKIDVGI